MRKRYRVHIALVYLSPCAFDCATYTGKVKAIFHWAEFCARGDIFHATEDEKVELLSTLLLQNFGGNVAPRAKFRLVENRLYSEFEISS